jgi:hypothetical protein
MTRSGTTQAVLAAMRAEGEALVLSFEVGRPVWRLLSSARRISPRTAQRIVNSVDVSASDDALFPGMPAQTYTVTRAR